MNREDVLSMLKALFDSFRCASAFVIELTELIANSGSEAAFFNLLLARLKFLRQEGVHAVKHKEFEPIGSGLFSMHLTGKDFNIRILYSFAPDRSPLLLTCFHERAGKRKTDYTPYIPVAQARKNDELEDFRNGN